MDALTGNALVSRNVGNRLATFNALGVFFCTLDALHLPLGWRLVLVCVFGFHGRIRAHKIILHKGLTCGIVGNIVTSIAAMFINELAAIGINAVSAAKANLYGARYLCRAPRPEASV